jgi:hypothetical protein
VSELKIDFGPGYRVYFKQRGDAIDVLWGGDKDTQDRDIRRAKELAEEFEKWTMAKLTAFDAAEYLDTPEAIAAYLTGALEEGSADAVAEAIGTVARARGMTEIASTLAWIGWTYTER